MTDTLQFQWVLPASEANALSIDLKARGATDIREVAPAGDDIPEDFDHAAFEPLTMLLGAALISAIARSILDFVRDARRSGLIIDARGETVKITPEPSLDRGTVVAVDATGTHLIDAKSPDRLAQLLARAANFERQ